MSNLFERTKLQKLWGKYSTDGGGAGASTYVDMQGWEGAYVMVECSTHTSSTGKIIVRTSSDASTGGAYTVTKTSGMNFTTGLMEVIVMDCYRPMKRYLSVKPVFTSGLIKGWALVKSTILKGFTVAMTS